MKRSQAVQTAATQLFAAETALDRALREASMLTVQLLDMRQAIGVSSVVGLDVMEHLSGAVASLHAGRVGMIRTHGALDDVKTRIGCRTVRLGGGMDKPEHDDVYGPTGLTVVGGTAEIEAA